MSLLLSLQTSNDSTSDKHLLCLRNILCVYTGYAKEYRHQGLSLKYHMSDFDNNMTFEISNYEFNELMQFC